MNAIKKCSTADMVGNCWANTWVRLNNDAAWAINYSGYESAMVLNDGTAVVFGSNGSSTSCSTLSGGGTGGATLTECFTITLDTNGLKKPNKIGKDIYILHVLENSIKPYGTPTDWVSIGYAANGLANYYSCDPKGDGELCAYDYLLNK